MAAAVRPGTASYDRAREALDACKTPARAEGPQLAAARRLVDGPVSAVRRGVRDGRDLEDGRTVQDARGSSDTYGLDDRATRDERSAPSTVESRELLTTRIFSVHAESVVLPSGLRQELAIVRHGGAVAVAALDEQGRLLLVRQYRHAVGRELEEVVAGRLEKGEQPLHAARRELEEEGGLRADHWEELARFFPAPGFCSEEMVLFLARGLHAVGADRRAMDADEEIEVLWRTPQEVLATSHDAKSLAAAALVLQRTTAAT